MVLAATPRGANSDQETTMDWPQGESLQQQAWHLQSAALRHLPLQTLLAGGSCDVPAARRGQGWESPAGQTSHRPRERESRR